MGAVAAGLIAGSAIKLWRALRGHALGPVVASGVVVAAFLGAAAWRLPLHVARTRVRPASGLATGWRLRAGAFVPAQPDRRHHRTDRMAGTDCARNYLRFELRCAEAMGRGTPRHHELHARQRAVALHVGGPSRQPAVEHVAGRPAHGQQFPIKALGQPRTDGR